VCFVNGLPLVFSELKAVYKNIRAGFDNNLTDYLHEHSIAHAFHHNAFLVVSNGDRARYGSITSRWEHFVQWKRNDEREKGSLQAETLLNGMLSKDRLLDLVENFILFDDSRAGGTRKIVARNHQLLEVNNAVASVQRQEELKREYPIGRRIFTRDYLKAAEVRSLFAEGLGALPLPVRAHPDLGRLGVFWHTQGSGKSYSMAFFVEKVRRVIPGNFTFLVMTDREELDEQIRRTFVGCGVADEKAPRPASGRELRAALSKNARFVFSLIHKFNQPVDKPYSERDDIIVISDEAHRTQAGKFARNMRFALPNAAFIGFTGTPLFKYDQLTRRIFGDYVSRYDFKRSEEDQSTVRLVYENRGEKLGIARLDLNDRIAEKIERAELDPDQTALLERLLGRDYEVITADDRLDKLADDDPAHPFRIAIVCAMWLTGFDVECLSTMYIDKPMKAHTLMQAIARANRVYPGKECGVIVDYNGMLKSLREALAQYALGDGEDGGGAEIVQPIEELVEALVETIEAAEGHLRGLGFEPDLLRGAAGFDRIQLIRDAVEAVYSSDDAKRRFEIMARHLFSRFKALLMEPSAMVYAERHDNIEAIYKKLQERRDTADVTDLLKELHKIVNEAIRAQNVGEDHAEGLTVDLSKLDFAKLREEFARKARRKNSALQDLREVIEQKLSQMLAGNPMRMDYYRRYQEIVADYNREKDRVTVEETFSRLMELAGSLDAEGRRAAQEGLTEEELALFDLLYEEKISKSDREKLKQASRGLLASIQEAIRPMQNWTEKESTRAEVRTNILDTLWGSLPRPPYRDEDTEALAERVYSYIFARSVSGQFLTAA